MDQNDIFKLLLIILLLINERDCCNQSECSGLCSINEIIIIMLLMNAFNGNVINQGTTTITQNINTTF